MTARPTLLGISLLAAGCASAPPTPVPAAEWGGGRSDFAVSSGPPSSVASLPAVARSELPHQVVRLNAVRRSGESTLGSGLVLCRVRDSAYVVSAMHVVTGEEAPGQPGGLRQLEALREIEVEFRGGTPHHIGSIEPLGPLFIENYDLLLLRVPLPPGYRLSAARIGDSARLSSGALVRTVGHDSETGKAWGEMTGGIVSDRLSDRDLLSYDADVPTGYSGGPVYDENGWVVGINRRKEAGVTHATRIEVAIREMRVKLPRECHLESIR